MPTNELTDTLTTAPPQLTGLLWIQLVVGQQNEAASLQETLFDVKPEPGALESD